MYIYWLGWSCYNQDYRWVVWAGMRIGGMGGGMITAMGMGGMGMMQVADAEPFPNADGGNGSIVQYHELLVVKNSQSVHGKIKSVTSK